MRGTWTIAVLIGIGLVIAGFFAQGMARLAGLPANASKPLPAASATPGAATSLTTLAPAADTKSTTSSKDAASAPASDVAEPSPTLQALATTADRTPDTHAADRTPDAQAVPTPNPLPAPAPAARRVSAAASAEAAARPLSASEMRDAQCRSLAAWLDELDAIARTRPDAASQAWVQSERATTHERQTELRC